MDAFPVTPKRRAKRGGGAVNFTLNEEIAGVLGSDIEVMALNLAVQKLEVLDERKSKIIELHFIGGLNYDETAAALNVSAATVHRDLRLAKAWLHQEIGAEVSP